MAFNRMTLPRIPTGFFQQLWWTFVQIPWEGVKIYGPQFLVAIPAAYASSQWANDLEIFPAPFHWSVGIAFEWIYMGVMAMAGSMVSRRWYYSVVLSAGFSSMLYVFLYSAKKYGLMGSWDTEKWKFFFALVHAVPLSGLNILYGLLIHSFRLEQAAAEAQERFKCTFPGCGLGFPSQKALNGHGKAHAKP